MIKPAERKKMKKVFKKGYSKEVLDKLNKNGIVTQKGTPYGISYITHVFNGRNENIDIEKRLWLYMMKKRKKRKNLLKKRKQFLPQKNPKLELRV
jgi:hypothetical protein